MRSVKPGKAKNAKARKGAAPRRARRWPVFVAAVGVVAIAAVGVNAFVSGSATGTVDAGVRALGLTVQDVTVSGRRNAPTHEILTALNVERGYSMLDFDIGRARARVLDVDWVQSAKVTRLLPDAIHVTIVEHTPYAVWQRSGRNYVIDADGATITEATPSVMEQLPFLVGEGAPEAAPKLFAMLDERPSIRRRVRAAVRVADRRWTLRLDGGVEVMLPAARAEAALDRLMQLQDSAELLDRKVRTVDLRVPDRLTVKRDEDEDETEGDAKS